jgi:hypothetical protein
MTELTLKTVGQSWRGTFGVLVNGEVPFALTMEQPWKDNEQEVSSIPAGRYLCRRVNSPHFGETFEITDVPGRTHILLHKGNMLADTRGCVLVGERFDGTYDHPFLAESKHGYAELMAMMAGESVFWLSVVR